MQLTDLAVVMGAPPVQLMDKRNCPPLSCKTLDLENYVSLTGVALAHVMGWFLFFF